MNIKLNITIREFKCLRETIEDMVHEAERDKYEWIIDNHLEEPTTVAIMIKLHTERQQRYRTILQKLNQAATTVTEARAPQKERV